VRFEFSFVFEFIASVKSPDLFSIEALGLHQVGQIVAMEGDPQVRHRLEEMGLRVGLEVRRLNQGSPVILAISHRRLSLRLNEQLQVWVRFQE
jgi:Fe2+ transport system protein FeoA